MIIIDRLDEIEQSLVTLAKFAKDEVSRLKSENESIKGMLSSSKSSKTLELEKKIDDLQRKIASLSQRAPVAESKEKISYLEKKIEELKNVKPADFDNRTAAMEQKILESKKTSGMLQSEITSLATEVDKLKTGAGEDESKAELKYYVEKLNERIEMLENELQNKLENTKINLDEEFQNRLDGLKMVLEDEAKKVLESLSKESTDEKAFKKELSSIEGLERKQTDELGVEEALIDKKMQDWMVKVKEMINEYNADKKFDELDEKVSLKLHALESLENKMNEVLGKNVSSFEEEESVEISAIDRKISDLHRAVTDMQHELSEFKQGEGIDTNSVRKEIDMLKKRMQQIDEHAKTTATRHMTKQLEEFAHYLDAKIPEVVTIDEFQRHMAAVNKRIDTIEAPDTTQIMQRVSALEKDIRDMLSRLQGIYTHMPKFVE